MLNKQSDHAIESTNLVQDLCSTMDSLDNSFTYLEIIKDPMLLTVMDSKDKLAGEDTKCYLFGVKQ